MVDDGGQRATAAAGPGPVTGAVAAAVRELLSVVPTGCTWLQALLQDGRVADFVVAAVSGQGEDIYGRGAGRIGERLSELYPSMVNGPLWQLYCQVLASGTAGELPDFRYEEHRTGIVADSWFRVSVHPVLGGLLVSWQRVDEARRRLDGTERLGSLGWAEYDLVTGRSDWSPGMFRLFEREPALGPMSRAEQAAAMLPEDRGLSETVWQTLDSGTASDMTVRFRLGPAVKHLRILSEVARDSAGNPLKVYAVVQDVTGREDSRSAIERLNVQLRTREMTALAEHRLAGQLQNMIQPVPREPFPLAGLEAVVSYLPAESAIHVGGDWYHAETLPDGRVVLAVGDVAGHGLSAANGMAHLRFSLVAWLSIGIRDPGTLLGHMNRLCLQLKITATAVVSLYDPQARTLSWARAGHLPPVLARAGAADDLDRPPGLLLGADPAAGYPIVGLRLERDDLVLFYTDGLVERRGSSTEANLGRVKRRLSELSSYAGYHGLARLRELLPEASLEDDTCTLAVRVLA